MHSPSLEAAATAQQAMLHLITWPSRSSGWLRTSQDPSRVESMSAGLLLGTSPAGKLGEQLPKRQNLVKAQGGKLEQDSELGGIEKQVPELKTKRSGGSMRAKVQAIKWLDGNLGWYHYVPKNDNNLSSRLTILLVRGRGPCGYLQSSSLARVWSSSASRPAWQSACLGVQSLTSVSVLGGPSKLCNNLLHLLCCRYRRFKSIYNLAAA